MSGIFGGGPKKPKPTDQERALAERGAKDFNRLLEILPAEDTFLRNIRATDEARNRLAGQASAQAAETFLGKGTDRAIGAGRGSGRSTFDVGDSSRAARKALGTAVGKTVPALQERELQGLLQVAATGRGINRDAQVGLGAAGRRATRKAITEEQQDLDLRRGLVSGASTAAGLYSSGLFDARKSDTT